jgi:putative ABC transport system permease protein
MNTLFGLSMNTIMTWMLAIFLIIIGVVVVLALLNPLLFKLGVRNIPRRRAQTILIVVGLMLSTVIITSAFGTGDTVSYSIRSAATTNLGAVDEMVRHTSGAGSLTQVAGGTTFIPEATLDRMRATLATNTNVDGVMGALVLSAALQDLNSSQTKNKAALVGIPISYPAAFGTLQPTDGSSPVTMGQLSPPSPAPSIHRQTAIDAGEVYINQRAADALNARAGDALHLYIGNLPAVVRVRAVLRDENLAAGGLLSNGAQADPTVLVPLQRIQALVGRPDQVTVVLVSNRGDAIGGAAYSDGATAQLRALLANTASVTSAKLLLTNPVGDAALSALIADPINAGVKSKLLDLQQQLLLPGLSDQLKSLLSDPKVNDTLKTIKQPDIAGVLNDTLSSISDYTVLPIKQSSLDIADLVGNVVTSIFVVFGLFSVAAGVTLIFLIFVMLAAERRAEMGMARAVGTKRRQLIEQFLFEGSAYNLLAAIAGVALGILVSLGMVRLMAPLFGATDFEIRAHIEPRSLVVSFCLGGLVTFLTVAFSSWRVSRLNVVAAIRDLPEDHGVDRSIGGAFRRPFDDLGAAWRRLRRGHPLGALRALLAALWHAISGWSVFISRGILLLPIGYLLAVSGVDNKQAFPFTMGASLLIIGLAMTLRWALGGLGVPDAVRNRLGYSLGGIGLVAFWLLPGDTLKPLTGELDSGMEMFFLSGVMLVIGAVWTVMYNSDLILGGLMRVFGASGRLAPILKTAISYPMQNRFRTGLTLGMFSLVIFTLMVMSVLIRSMDGSMNLNRDAGGWPIYGAVNPDNPIQALPQTLATTPSLRGVTAYGGLAQLGVGLRQPGQADQRWQPYLANIADTTYLTNQRWALHSRATGFSSDAQVWNTLRTNSGYAVVDDTLIQRKANYNMGAVPAFTISGFYYEDKTFQPTTIEMRDPRSGTVLRLTVIGVLDFRAEYLPALTPGVYTGEQTLLDAGAPPTLPNVYVFRVAPNQNVHAVALALGKAFTSNGLDVKESQHEYDVSQSLNLGLNDLLMGFMGLGLIVGIAALGVIAFRSVVERRQQIGMLRAIGYRRSMVRNGFLLESSFVSILGTLLGVALGLALARNLVAEVAKSSPGITMTIPWLQVVAIVLIAYLASLLTTIIPAWQASRVYPAEALRYE